MNNRRTGLISIALLTADLMLASASAYAQAAGITAPLAGVVSDTGGRIASSTQVVVRNNATRDEHVAVTDDTGWFVVPALNPGTYTVTVSLLGYQTLVLPDIPLTAATPVAVKAVLWPGDVAERVVVEGAYEMLQVQTAAVHQTIVIAEIERYPLRTHNALDLTNALTATMTTGVGGAGTIISGLPNVTMNIALDGVNVQDTYLRNASGFAAPIRPPLESIQEITVTSSTPGADSAGHGAVQIRMVTRAGSNRFSGAIYNSWRNQAGTNDEDVLTRNEKSGWLWRLNTPYWFNKRDRPKTPAGDYFIDDIRLQTPGFRVGGPVVIPKLFDGRDKAFFFFNWESFLWPNQFARTRYLLNTKAQQGLFTYPAADGSGYKTIDLLALSASKGYPSTIDPIVGKVLADIRSAAAGWTAGGLSSWDVNNDKFDYSPSGEETRQLPTLRLDVNVTRNHRVTFTGRYVKIDATPDFLNNRESTFPGFANSGGRYGRPYMVQAAVRSAFGRSVVNEARAGYQAMSSEFCPEVGVSQFACSGPGCQGGYNLLIGNYAIGTNALTTATANAGRSSRDALNVVVEDTLTWLKGRHTISAGASLNRISFDNMDTPGSVVPGVIMTLAPAAPNYSMWAASSGNYPGGISDTYATYARNLYSLLTGTVNQINGTAVLDANEQYQYLGERWQKGRLDEFGVFISDSWRPRPDLTLTGGLRWELQFPFETTVSTWARPDQWTDIYGVTGADSMFKPGTMTGRTPLIAQFEVGDPAFQTDWNNVAPSVGAAWRPHIGQRWLRAVLGSDPVFRGGYSLAYTRYGTYEFASMFGSNPGSTRNMTRSVPLGNLGTDGLPVLLSQTSRLQPPPTPAPPTYPFSPEAGEAMGVMAGNLTVPYAHQYSLGWQRELGKAWAVEVRYVGNRFTGGWTYNNLNRAADRFIVENGFLEEFKLAQRNLQANIAAGKGNTFAYTGAPGTSPLPIFLAHFGGIPLTDARNQVAANYTASQFRSASFYDSLSPYNPNIANITSTGSVGLQYVNLQDNRRKAGLPENFWVANPTLLTGAAYLMYNGGTTGYDGLQLEVNQRMSRGLSLMAGYQFGRTSTWSRPTLREGFETSLATNGVDHSIKLGWIYELPFGRGRTFGSGVPAWLNHVIGNWEFDGVGMLQSGAIVDFGNYRLVGMTDEDLQRMFKIYKRPDASGVERVYMLPEDVIQQSIIALYGASSTSPTGWTGPAPTGQYIARPDNPQCVQAYPGQCAPLHHFVRGPWSGSFDMAFVKRFALGKGLRVEARMELYNVFDAIGFAPVAGLGSTMSGWEVTQAGSDTNGSQWPGGRMTQFSLRFSW